MKVQFAQEATLRESPILPSAFAPDGFKEGYESSITMPEDDPQTFELFLHWLYQGALPHGLIDDDFHPLLHLYIFAEKLCLDEVANKTMDALQAIGDGPFDLPNLGNEEVDTIWRNTSEASPMRMWCVRLLLHVVWDENAFAEYDSRKSPLLFSELSDLWEFFRDHQDLFDMFFSLVQRHTVDDEPLNRYSKDGSKACYFHQHAKGEICYLGKRNEEE